MKRHEKGSGVLVVARETAKFSPKSLASSAAALRHGPASALAIANIKEADRGNITGAPHCTGCAPEHNAIMHRWNLAKSMKVLEVLNYRSNSELFKNLEGHSSSPVQLV